ncbi:hypothetical protein HON22_01890 [Candidatus Peregrinibacteria bacterium]|jgi:hypothetical protein|nr:hypothetical protein [Candidatus Peregrinibacteria bacterium]
MSDTDSKTDGILTPEDLENLLVIPEEEKDIIDFSSLTKPFEESLKIIQEGSERTQKVLQKNEKCLDALYERMENSNIQLPPRG